MFSKVVLGLGNPGPRYFFTRHNAGFLAVALMAKKYKAVFSRSGRMVELARATINNHSTLLARPLTYMNRSGGSYLYLHREYGIEPSDLLVLVDDINLPMGAIRIRESGGDGGHNGLLSLIQACETEEFTRIRMGIGPLTGDMTDFVLDPLRGEDAKRFVEQAKVMAEAAEAVIIKGEQFAMNYYNQRAIQINHEGEL